MSEIIAIEIIEITERKLTQQAKSNSVGCMLNKPPFDHIIQGRNVTKIVEKVYLLNMSGLPLHGESHIKLLNI